MARLGGIGSQYFDANGDPLSGGKLYFYDTGTLNAKATYDDAAQTIPNTNPVILDAAGVQPDIFLDGPAKMVVTDADDVEVFEIDPVGVGLGVLGETYYDANGVPLAGGKLYFYESGTLLEKSTYSDSELTTENPNPVVLDSLGNQPDIFFAGDVRVILTKANDVQLRTLDNVEQGSLQLLSQCRPHSCDSYREYLTDNSDNAWAFDEAAAPFGNISSGTQEMSLLVQGDGAVAYRFLDLYDSCDGKKFARFRNNSGTSSAQAIGSSDLFGDGDEPYFIGATLLAADFTQYAGHIMAWSPRGLDSGYDSAGGDYSLSSVSGFLQFQAPYRPNNTFTHSSSVAVPDDGEPHSYSVFVADSNDAGPRAFKIYLDWVEVDSGEIPEGPPTSGAIDNVVFLTMGRGDDSVVAYGLKTSDAAFEPELARIALQRNESDYAIPAYCET